MKGCEVINLRPQFESLNVNILVLINVAYQFSEHQFLFICKIKSKLYENM